MFTLCFWSIEMHICNILFSLFTSLLCVWYSGSYQAWNCCPSWPEIVHSFSWRIKGRERWESVHCSSQWLPININLCPHLFLKSIWEVGKTKVKGRVRRHWLPGCLGDGETSEVHEHLLLFRKHGFCPFSSLWTRRALLPSLLLFLFLHPLLTFLLRKGDGGL